MKFSYEAEHVQAVLFFFCQIEPRFSSEVYSHRNEVNGHVTHCIRNRDINGVFRCKNRLNLPVLVHASLSFEHRLFEFT